MTKGGFYPPALRDLNASDGNKLLHSMDCMKKSIHLCEKVLPRLYSWGPLWDSAPFKKIYIYVLLELFPYITFQRLLLHSSFALYVRLFLF